MPNEKLISALLRPVNGAAVVILGAYTFVWGLWVASPFWEVFTRAELYGALSILAPEVFWGILAIFCGVVIMWGAWKRSEQALIVASLVGGWHWAMIAFFYFLGDVTNTGGITSLTFSIYAVYTYLNLKVNSKSYTIDE